MRAFTILFVFVFIAVSGFAQEKNNEVIVLQRGACFGSCPQFKITIYKDGTAIYEGERNVEKTGIFSKKLFTAEVNELIKKFRKSKFCKFKNEYSTLHTDFPETVISFTDKGKTKKIIHYNIAPQKLLELEIEIDKIADQPGWDKLSELKN